VWSLQTDHEVPGAFKVTSGNWPSFHYISHHFPHAFSSVTKRHLQCILDRRQLFRGISTDYTGHCYYEILIIGFPLVDSRNQIGEKDVILYTTKVVFTKLDIYTQEFSEA
jgi:hypothetical protein